MTKKKRAHFAENLTFSHLFQYSHIGVVAEFPIKGKWNEEFFHNSNPVVLELGCGKGEYTVNLALRYPERNFIGMDIKPELSLYQVARCLYCQAKSCGLYLDGAKIANR